MENINDIKIKLIQKVCESENHCLLSSFLKNLENQSKDIVNEPDLLYKSEKPMTDEEVEEYFKEEEMVLPDYIMKMIDRGMEDVKNGHVVDNEEVEKYFEEWLKD